jgi:hypothetical protein
VMQPDLTFRHDYCATAISKEMAAKMGVAPGRSVYRFVGVQPWTQRGDAFLLAFNEATDGTHLAEYCEEDGRLAEILEMHIPPEDWDAFKRQARLAAVTMHGAQEDPQ